MVGKPFSLGLVHWWRTVGIKAGVERYDRYLSLFGLDVGSFVGSTVADMICGPFGGMLSLVQAAQRRYALDRFPDSYNKMGLSPIPILGPNHFGTWAVPASSCDMVFCLDVLDHEKAPAGILGEITRITKPGGRLYLFAHTSEQQWEQNIHTLRWLAHHVGQVPGTIKVTRGHQWSSAACWRWAWAKRGKDRVNEDPFARAVWGCVIRQRVGL